ncbi:hypothetical protein phi1422_0038 [Bdellovibrio phage phi1422]|uniref:hypothetical protein n=1 Tax=Bdellovibrio phage phi1422 TaxID=1127515 RepID=UPI0002536D5A|nr:hypothetical protein F395_gp38 [Bdellovibrio phage phi1422]AFC22558.1 hypothetical protein phi1422_0038 [Bdellovibrio phage phi1422]
MTSYLYPPDDELEKFIKKDYKKILVEPIYPMPEIALSEHDMSRIKLEHRTQMSIMFIIYSILIAISFLLGTIR